VILREVPMMTEAAPYVRFEPCAAYEGDAASSFGCCAVCGWLSDDHEAHARAVVARLPVRRTLERRAS
jgi:hypothetical protein